MDSLNRIEALVGKDALKKLAQSQVWIFGVGGIGSYVAEAIARGGVGSIVLVDRGTVNATNINRQSHASHSTVGKSKAEAMRDKIHDINPNVRVTSMSLEFTPNTAHEFNMEGADYAVVTIGNTSDKIEVIKKAQGSNVPVIVPVSSDKFRMVNTGFVIADIDDLSDSRIVTINELKKAGLSGFKVIYDPTDEPDIQLFPGSSSWVAPIEGFMVAGEVIKDLIEGV